MKVEKAKAIAQEWVTTHTEGVQEYGGAICHGSANWLADDDELPSTSDVDIMIIAQSSDGLKLGLFEYEGIKLDISHITPDRISSAEAVLSDYHMAGHFKNHCVVADPTGMLGALQSRVESDYPKRAWIRKRCENARQKVLQNITMLKAVLPYDERVSCWLFAAGVLTHIVLVAGLKSPTVRLRYYEVRMLLEEYGMEAAYEDLLRTLGCINMESATVSRHLSHLSGAFDRAMTIENLRYRFASSISKQGRISAIDGSSDLIADGYHREAVFYMLATYSRCAHLYRESENPVLYERYLDGYHELLMDLGITSDTDLFDRGAEVEASLPRVMNVADDIIMQNADVLD